MRSLTKALSLSITSALLAISLGACGDEGGGKPPVKTVRDDERKVSTLTPAQMEEVCADQFDLVTEEQLKGTAKVLCTIQLAISGGSCDPAAIQECADAFAQQARENSGKGCNDDVDLTKCDVTVGQLSSCQLDSLEQLSKASASVTCENIFTGGLPTDAPASCKIVDEKCPSALE